MKRYFDLHCDTLFELYKTKQKFKDNNLSISEKKAAGIEKYGQIFAVWSDNKLSEGEQYDRFIDTVVYCKQIGFPAFSTGETFDELNKRNYFLAVEGAGLLNSRIQKLDILYKCKVRFLTLVWQDECCIGGAFNTDVGFTTFGKQVLDRCFELGIVPDVSHASDEMFWQVYDRSKEVKKPFICNHKRNLTDSMFDAIVEVGGIVGVSFAPIHLSGESASVSDVIKHIEYYLSLGGENTVCIGGDLDGVSTLPEGIDHIGSVYIIAEELAKMNYSDELIDKIMFSNANTFIKKSVK